jgi:hypothetical protein
MLEQSATSYNDAVDDCRVVDDAQPVQEAPALSFSQRLRQTAANAFRIVFHHVTRHVGAGMVASVAYFDPYVAILRLSHSPGLTFVLLQRQLGSRFASRVSIRLAGRPSTRIDLLIPLPRLRFTIRTAPFWHRCSRSPGMGKLFLRDHVKKNMLPRFLHSD